MKVRQLIPDYIKGMAIVLMVYGHVNHVGLMYQFQRQIVVFIYTFHMPLFLILSGFFFTTKNNPLEGGKRILDRLVRPYFIFISLYLLGVFFIQKIGIATSNAAPESFSDFFSIIFLRPRGAYWFMHSLILIQLCFVFGELRIFRKSERLIVPICLLAVECVLGLVAVRTVLYFLLGMTLGRLGLGLPSWGKLGFVFVFIIICFAWQDIYEFSVVQVVWCFSIISLLSGIGYFVKNSICVFMLSWIGRNSVVILVLHALFVVLLKVTSKMFLEIDRTGIFYSVMVVSFSVFGSLLAAIVFDKIRISHYLFGVDSIYSDYHANGKVHLPVVKAG